MTRRALVAVALLTLITQLVSAATGVDKTNLPVNAAQEIAGHLAWDGRYEGGNWVRLKGRVRPEDPPLRAFSLPGYPWYAAAMWRAAPWARRYIQIPAVVLLTVAVAATAAALGGPTLGLLSGIVAALDPFLVIHGPVWDDAVFGTAVVWVMFAVAAHRWRRGINQVSWLAWTDDILVAALAALSALTRTESRALVLALAAVVWALPTLRPLRRGALFAVAGVAVAMAAWGMRNERALGVFDTGSTHDGVTLWESNSPISRRALAMGQVDHLSNDSSVMLPYWSQTTAMTEAGADAFFRAEAVRYITSHPVDVAETAADKLLVSVSGIRPERPLHDTRNVVSIVDDALLIILSAFAVVRLARRPRDEARTALLALLAAATALVTGFLLIGPAGIRYWLTLRAAAWILAAYAVVAPRRKHLVA